MVYPDIFSSGEDVLCQRGLLVRGKGGKENRGDKGARRNGGKSLKMGAKGPFLSVSVQGEDVGLPPGGGSTCGLCRGRMKENA